MPIKILTWIRINCLFPWQTEIYLPLSKDKKFKEESILKKLYNIENVNSSGARNAKMYTLENRVKAAKLNDQMSFAWKCYPISKKRKD